MHFGIVIFPEKLQINFLPADYEGHDSGNRLRDPEGVPYSGSAENAAQYKRGRKNNEYITTQGDHQRSGSLSKSLQRAGGSDGYGGYQESGADNAKRRPSGLYGGFTGSKEPYELSGDCQAD